MMNETTSEVPYGVIRLSYYTTTNQVKVPYYLNIYVRERNPSTNMRFTEIALATAGIWYPKMQPAHMKFLYRSTG